MLVVHWLDGDSQRYPFVWLRDNCHCSQCYSSGTKTKAKYLQDWDLDVTADAASISEDGQMLNVTWNDNHVTALPSNWLRCQRFHQTGGDSVMDAELEFWGSDVMSSDRLRTFKFQDLLESDEALLDWLREIQILGISVVKDTPLESRQIHKLGERIGFITQTTFGVQCEIKSMLSNDDIAFSNGYLPPHTDLSFHLNPPYLGLFHCIVQTRQEGGENQLIDGFKAAYELKDTAPEAFQLITSRNIEHYGIADHEDITPKGLHHQSRHPVIRLESNGKVQQITNGEFHHNAAVLRVPVEDVLPLYKALKAFNQILLREDNIFCYKLVPGDILCFNNHRVLHGRSPYQLSSRSVERHLQTCYFDIDCVTSRIRVLMKHAGKQSL